LTRRCGGSTRNQQDSAGAASKDIHRPQAASGKDDSPTNLPNELKKSLGQKGRRHPSLATKTLLNN